jgi:hypothetical protein
MFVLNFRFNIKKYIEFSAITFDVSFLYFLIAVVSLAISQNRFIRTWFVVDFSDFEDDSSIARYNVVSLEIMKRKLEIRYLMKCSYSEVVERTLEEAIAEIIKRKFISSKMRALWDEMTIWDEIIEDEMIWDDLRWDSFWRYFHDTDSRREWFDVRIRF